MTGVLKSEFHMDNDMRLVHKITQPTEDVILARNARLRNNPGAIRDLGAKSGETWGRQIASIPENLLLWASKNGYDIYNKDADIRSREIFRFLQSDKGKPCLIREKL